jgi:hypothetical protein
VDRLNLLPLLRAKLDIDTPYSGAAMTNGFVRPFSESGFIDRAHALSLPPNGREVAQELYLDGLRKTPRLGDAGPHHGRQLRVEHYPELKAKMESHRREKDAQLQRVEKMLND